MTYWNEVWSPIRAFPERRRRACRFLSLIISLLQLQLHLFCNSGHRVHHSPPKHKAQHLNSTYNSNGTTANQANQPSPVTPFLSHPLLSVGTIVTLIMFLNGYNNPSPSIVTVDVFSILPNTGQQPPIAMTVTRTIHLLPPPETTMDVSCRQSFSFSFFSFVSWQQFKHTLTRQTSLLQRWRNLCKDLSTLDQISI